MTVDTNLEKLRLTIGDTDVGDSGNNAIFKDAELNWFLSAEADSIPNAALRAAYAAQAKFARAYDFETDGQRFNRSQMSKAFADLAKSLEKAGARLTGASAIRTVDITKIDGWSDDVANQETSLTSSTTNPRRRYYGKQDDIP